MTITTGNLSKQFGGLVVLQDISLAFPEDSVTAIVGPNGAGKTTLLNVMAGFVAPDRGSVYLTERSTGVGFGPLNSSLKRTDLSKLMPHERASAGLGVLFQDIRVFRNLSALENVAVARKPQLGEKLFNCFFRPHKVSFEESQVIEDSSRFLRLLGLDTRSDASAGELSYGEQKLIAMARLLASDSKVLLLDEPTAGVHAERIGLPMGLVRRRAHDEARTAVIIEHNLDVVREFADWACLLINGRVEGWGTPDQVLRQSRTSLRNAYGPRPRQ